MHKWVELLIQFIGLFQCWTYIDPYEETLVIRAGKFHRKRGPGWCWLWPMNYEDVITENVKPEPVMLEVQSLHTLDDYAVNICVGMEYEIIDLKVHELDFESSHATNCMIAAGCITDMVRGNKFKDIDDSLVKSIRSTINKKIKKRGGHLTEMMLQDLSNGEAIRYWHEGIELDFGDE
jgi:regulator of protease activity HflC (stomatin/prohibitin superfamily)